MSPWLTQEPSAAEARRLRADLELGRVPGWRFSGGPLESRAADEVRAAPEPVRILAGLEHLGQQIEARERRAWAEEEHLADALDGRARDLWGAWLAGHPWEARAGWEELYLAPAERTFRAICLARELPAEVRGRVVSDLREAFFYALVGGQGPFPGWAELAVRVLETAGADGPVCAVAPLLANADLSRLTRCAATRGSWRQTLATLWTDLPEESARALRSHRLVASNPSQLEALLDLHVLRKVVAAWPADPWPRVTQNRGRARGRLRAALAESRGPELSRALLGLDALHSRTRAATQRFAWAWAWAELARDFSFDLDRTVTPACVDAGSALAPLSASDHAALRTWVLLVLLRGRRGHLERWVRTGSTGDRDSAWARLLATLPDDLADPASPGARTRTYHRVRTALSDSLCDHQQGLASVLAALARLEGGRGLRGRFTAAVGGAWDARVPLPRTGFPRLVEQARRARAAHLEDPCHSP